MKFSAALLLGLIAVSDVSSIIINEAPPASPSASPAASPAASPSADAPAASPAADAPAAAAPADGAAKTDGAKADGAKTEGAGKDGESKGSLSCDELPWDKKKACVDKYVEARESQAVAASIKSDEAYYKNNTEFRDGIVANMRKENAWINGKKVIEDRTNPIKKEGWDVPMDETNAHPNLVKPSNYEEPDQPHAMHYINATKAGAEPKKEEAKAEAKA